MVLEIFIYLAITFGILILCITMLEKDDCFNENYVILKKENAKIKVTVETEGLSEEDAKRVGWIIRKGRYQDIYDIVNEYIILTK